MTVAIVARNLGALVMAAGASRRFGSDKRRYDDGSGALLRRTLNHVLALDVPTCVALRAGDEPDTPELLGEALHAVTVLYVEDADRGLGHSIARCFQTPPDWDGALIFLADMPNVAPSTAQHLLQHFDAGRIQAPTYDDRRGHPVLFPRTFFGALAQLKGDTGARDLLSREENRVALHPVDDPGIHWDLDTPPPS